jgi:hypothetical protein
LAHLQDEGKLNDSDGEGSGGRDASSPQPSHLSADDNTTVTTLLPAAAAAVNAGLKTTVVIAASSSADALLLPSDPPDDDANTDKTLTPLQLANGFPADTAAAVAAAAAAVDCQESFGLAMTVALLDFGGVNEFSSKAKATLIATTATALNVPHSQVVI